MDLKGVCLHMWRSGQDITTMFSSVTELRVLYLEQKCMYQSKFDTASANLVSLLDARDVVWLR